MVVLLCRKIQDYPVACRASPKPLRSFWRADRLGWPAHINSTQPTVSPPQTRRSPKARLTTCDAVSIVCRNCHRKLSDGQLDHPVRLFNLDEQGRPQLRKASAHGLGHLRPPYSEAEPPGSIRPPIVSLHEIGVERWQHDLRQRIKSYRSALSNYHLHTESKFLNGDSYNRGPTRRRHVTVQAIRYIGKEANHLEEQY